MNTLVKIFFFTFIFLSAGSAQNIGQFDNNVDVGNPIKPGFATFNSDNQEYTIGGAGVTM